MCAKGQLISKTNCQAEDSSKKQTNEFVFTSMRRVFVHFFEESSAIKETFRDYLTFMTLRVFFVIFIIGFPVHQGFGSIVMLGRPAEAAHTALTKTQ